MDHQKRLEALASQYRWKAENNIRFYELLGMTTEQKVEFLAKEFATIHWLVEIDAPSMKHFKTTTKDEKEDQHGK
jgi:hypothetical protein